MLPRLGIAAVVSVPYTSTNEAHPFSVHLLDADGGVIPLGETGDGPIHRIQGEFNVGRPPELPAGVQPLTPSALRSIEPKGSSVTRCRPSP